MSANPPLVELREIRKAFGGVKAVDGVSVNLYPGEVVALLGHNGAGKSTLMKMLAGAYPIDSGDTLIAGEKVNIRTPSEAQAQGIETIYQTLAPSTAFTPPKALRISRSSTRGGLALI